MKSVKSKGIVKSKSVKVVKKKKVPVKKVKKDSELANKARSLSNIAQMHDFEERSSLMPYRLRLSAICDEKPELYAIGYNFSHSEALAYKKVTRTFFTVNDAHVCMQVEKKEKTTFVIPILIEISDKSIPKGCHPWVINRCDKLERFGVITIRPKSADEMEFMLSEII